MVSKTARGGRLHMPQAGAQIAVAMTIGVLQPPVVWIAGREPPPPPIVPPRPAPAGSAGCTVPGSFGLRASLWTAQTAQKCSYVRRVNRINSCYRAGLFALRGEKGCGESMTHRLCSWTSVRCCEPPMKSKRRSERNSCQCHCAAQCQSEYAVVGCLHDAIVARRKKRGSAGHVRRDTPDAELYGSNCSCGKLPPPACPGTACAKKPQRHTQTAFLFRSDGGLQFLELHHFP